MAYSDIDHIISLTPAVDIVYSNENTGSQEGNDLDLAHYTNDFSISVDSSFHFSSMLDSNHILPLHLPNKCWEDNTNEVIQKYSQV